MNGFAFVSPFSFGVSVLFVSVPMHATKFFGSSV